MVDPVGDWHNSSWTHNAIIIPSLCQDDVASRYCHDLFVWVQYLLRANIKCGFSSWPSCNSISLHTNTEWVCRRVAVQTSHRFLQCGICSAMNRWITRQLNADITFSVYLYAMRLLVSEIDNVAVMFRGSLSWEPVNTKLITRTRGKYLLHTYTTITHASTTYKSLASNNTLYLFQLWGIIWKANNTFLQGSLVSLKLSHVACMHQQTRPLLFR